jgi:hypothetical protein
MNTSIAQTVALAAHARARRIDVKLGGDDEYWSRHSTLKYVRTVKFTARHDSGASETIVATTPAGWLATIPVEADVEFLAPGPGTMFSPLLPLAFAGRTEASIVVRGSAGIDAWTATWEVVAPHSQEKIWGVSWLGEKTGRIRVPGGSVNEARRRLADVLLRISEFAARDTQLSTWCEWFAKAQAALADPAPVPIYHPDLFPPSAYSLSARQLLAASVQAHVFGGMGSWNDGPPEGRTRPQYDRLSGELYDAIMLGLTIATNAGDTGSS